MIKEIKEVLAKYSQDNYESDFELKMSNTDGVQAIEICAPDYNLKVEAQLKDKIVFVICRENNQVFCVEKFTETEEIEEVVIGLVDASIESIAG